MQGSNISCLGTGVSYLNALGKAGAKLVSFDSRSAMMRISWPNAYYIPSIFACVFYHQHLIVRLSNCPGAEAGLVPVHLSVCILKALQRLEEQAVLVNKGDSCNWDIKNCCDQPGYVLKLWIKFGIKNSKIPQ